MTNRERKQRRGAPQRPQGEQHQLDRRRAEMQAAEGHAGSIPRGNQRTERELMGSHGIAWDRVLGH